MPPAAVCRRVTGAKKDYKSKLLGSLNLAFQNEGIGKTRGTTTRRGPILRKKTQILSRGYIGFGDISSIMENQVDKNI